MLAALRNALRVVGKELPDCRIVVCGVGAAGHGDHPAAAAAGPGDIVAVDVARDRAPGRPGLDDHLAWSPSTPTRPA